MKELRRTSKSYGPSGARVITLEQCLIVRVIQQALLSFTSHDSIHVWHTIRRCEVPSTVPLRPAMSEREFSTPVDTPYERGAIAVPVEARATLRGVDVSAEVAAATIAAHELRG